MLTRMESDLQCKKKRHRQWAASGKLPWDGQMNESNTHQNDRDKMTRYIGLYN